MFAPVESTKFLQRRKIVTLVGAISYVLLAIYYIVRVILVSVYWGYLEEIDFNASIPALIIFAIISLVLAFCMFMLYKKTKHIDLQEE